MSLSSSSFRTCNGKRAASNTCHTQWQAINNMLFNSIGYLDRLCTQLTFLEEFFAVINNIISINLKHACDQVIAGDKDVLGTLVTLKYSMFDLRRKVGNSDPLWRSCI